MESFVSVIYAILSFTSTILLGKGKYTAFIFGITASLLYSILAFKNHLWGSVALSILCYLPLESLSLYKWYKNTNPESKSIYKLKLNRKKFILWVLIAVIISLILSCILFLNHDKSPILDGFITVFSVFATYLTMKRVLEQWIIWTVVNILTVSMWIIMIIKGSNSYSVAILWGIYVVLGIRFYFQWKKEINSTPQ